MAIKNDEASETSLESDEMSEAQACVILVAIVAKVSLLQGLVAHNEPSQESRGSMIDELVPERTTGTKSDSFRQAASGFVTIVAIPLVHWEDSLNLVNGQIDIMKDIHLTHS